MRLTGSRLTQVFRFAPSPNGFLHLGHAFSALLNERLAQAHGGMCLLRIEDIDRGRCRPEYEAGISEDLRWLGFSWSGPVRRQSEHMAEYRAAFETLVSRGLAFPCFCSRGAIARKVSALEAASGTAWPRDPDGSPLYPGTCRSRPDGEVDTLLGSGRPHAWRLRTDAALSRLSRPLGWTWFEPDRGGGTLEADPARWGDAVVVRKDIAASYHLSVVVDDHLQGVTHVVRGRDLEAATDLHVLLQALLGLHTPRYHHHRLILDAEGAKLSKSLGSRTLRDMREAGLSAAELRRALGFA